jgi:hypothetical protein
MAYKVDGTAYLKDDKTAETFENVTVTNHYTLFAGIGASASTGYTIAGITSPTNTRNTIDSFPFASDANASDVGDTTSVIHFQSGQSSSSHGYSSGGSTGNPASHAPSNIIQRIPFSVNANATDVGDLTVNRRGLSGQSSLSNGYACNGYHDGTTTYYNIIDKFPFASDTTNSSDAGDLTQTRSAATGTSSRTHGYVAGGYAVSDTSNVIDKFPFSTDANATDVGDLTQSTYSGANQSSETHGYTSGGTTTSNNTGLHNVIDKFPFSSDANASDVGDLVQARYLLAGGQSSSSHGYSSGGYIVPDVNTIDKFPFSTDANASDVGDLTQARYGTGGAGVQG